ncbi:PA14 domain-containing protein, partial [Streptomyces sp. uw30]|uniref:PA14 domain-containing protein n=1 Tax=Streptomyces sp. uw30 TaxID=1828179 RepID=UPI0021CA60EF
MLVGSFLVGGVWAAPPSVAAPDDIPPQEPGVTLRVFDTQVPLSKLCTLKPGQTPNHDKLMPTVDWSTTGDFGGFADNFTAEASGYLVVPDDGSYTFRLTSDDGSRLTIDDRTVIDHDVLDTHGLAQPARHLLHGHLVATRAAGDVVEEVHLARRGLRAAPGGDGQAAVGKPVHAGDLGLEAVRAEVGEGEVGAYVGQRQTVARAVRSRLALFASG